ncbi:exosome complex component RRP40-like isoform X2 [Ostrea edulis]|uniref:exosome complex component RRP40-like isoform X2 n=1 Tax=Ostrea edulis TaxID=37623 RepID=UPI0024AF0DC7|nr:exosome complex component RRP40-like isoform X2 [Ostrea edulis]
MVENIGKVVVPGEILTGLQKSDLTSKYVPQRGDSVIGIITAKAGDVFRVDVGANELATLSYLAFEGATKRNRPDVKVGDIVYSKFLVANKDMEPELVCIDGHGKSASLGIIGRDGGMVVQVPIDLIRKILSPDCVLFKSLGKSLKYEVAVGMNGRIWIKCHTVMETIVVANAITTSQYMTNEQIRDMCGKLTDSLAGF